jgi:hypothetical protein
MLPCIRDADFARLGFLGGLFSPSIYLAQVPRPVGAGGSSPAASRFPPEHVGRAGRIRDFAGGFHHAFQQVEQPQLGGEQATTRNVYNAAIFHN